MILERFDPTGHYTVTAAAKLWGVSRRTMTTLVAENPWLREHNRMTARKYLLGYQLNRLYNGTKSIVHNNISFSRSGVRRNARP